MAKGASVSKVYEVPRAESRIPMEVGVQISGHRLLPGIETTFTEDVSSRGARVRSIRRWVRDDKLSIRTLTGGFHCLARVAYCLPQRGADFAVGLEFIEPAGQWIIAPPQ